MIPKKIYFAWFGTKEMPELEQSNIATAKRLCPDFEIGILNERTFDINAYPYARWAYDKKIWSYVSDAARLWAMANGGGIYLDTDQTLTRCPSDLLHYDSVFFQTRFWLDSAPMISSPEMGWFYQSMLDELNRQAKENDVHDNIISIMTKMMHKNYDLRPVSKQVFADNVCVLNVEDYTPNLRQPISSGFAIHSARGSWLGCGYEINEYLGFDIFANGVYDKEKTTQMFPDNIIGRMDLTDRGFSPQMMKYTNYFFNKRVIGVDGEGLRMRRYGTSDTDVKTIYKDDDVYVLFS